jgi:hypothetical protein
MTRRLKNGTDQAWPDAVRYGFGFNGAGAAETLWRCDVLRGGRVYNSGLFATRVEAEQFAQQLVAQAPDHTFSVEAIKASAVWN